MIYFIYPNGSHSLMLAHNLALLGKKYRFLDDFKNGLSLNENLTDILALGGGWS